MRARIAAFLAGVLVVLGGYAWAAQTGGFPSRPRFQAVTVTGAVSAGSATVAGNAVFNGNRSTQGLWSALLSANAPSLGWYEADASADNRRWFFNANSEQLLLGTLNDAESVGAGILVVERTGIVVDSINLQATSVQANGRRVGVPAYGGFESVSASSSCNAWVGQVYGVSACSYIGAGTVRITWDPAFANHPVCVASPRGVGAVHVNVVAVSASVTEVRLYDSTFTPTGNASFTIACHGV